MTKVKKNKLKNGIVFTGKAYSYVLRVPDPMNGGTKPKWFGGFSTANEAKLARDKTRVVLANHEFIAPEKITFGAFLDSWIEKHSKHLKLSTAYKYRQLIRLYIHPKLGMVKIQQLRATQIETFYNDLLTNPGIAGKKLSPSTVSHCGAIIKKSLKYAVEMENLIAANPASRVPFPRKNPTIPSPWAIDELNRFLSIAESHRLGFFFRLAAFTGARRGELLALRWSDFDGKAISISKSRLEVGGEVYEQNSTKGGSNGQRRVVLDTGTISALNGHRKRQLVERMTAGPHWKDGDFIFTQELGLPLDPGTPTHLFKKLTAMSDLRPIRLHDLRHLHATELLRLGEPLHVVAKRLGHRDAMVTATIYAHVTNEQAESASSRFAEAVRSAN